MAPLETRGKPRRFGIKEKFYLPPYMEVMFPPMYLLLSLNADVL